MGTIRDRYIKKAGRPANLIRLEAFRRLQFRRVAFFRSFILSILHDSGLSRRDRVLVSSIYSRFSSQSTVTKHRSRCKATGRSRQVKRNVLLARMQFKLLASEGQLPNLRLGKYRR